MEDESMYSKYLHLRLSKRLPPFEEGRKYSVRIRAPPAGGWPNPSVTVRPSTLLDLPPAPKSPSLYIHLINGVPLSTRLPIVSGRPSQEPGYSGSLVMA